MKYREDINDTNWFIYTYYELNNIEDENIRDKYIEMYRDEFYKLCKLYLDYNFEFGKAISEYYYLLEDEKRKNESTYLFPRDTIYFYPKINVKIARKKHACFISGALIFPGSEYISYKAFLYDKTKDKSFVTPEIITEVGADFSFPLTLEEFEIFLYRIDNSYNLGLEKEYSIQSSLKTLLVRSLGKHE